MASAAVERCEGAGERCRPFRLRVATAGDAPELAALIRRSAHGLNAGRYEEGELAAAVAHVFGVDTQLVADGTCYVVEEDGAIVGCGGWSARRTLFGGDRWATRDATPLDPAADAARIRAFFVDPAHARRGIGRLLLDASEDAARAAGFGRAELMATLPGEPFYRAAGYRPGAPVLHAAGDTAVRFVPMTKELDAATGTTRRAPVPQVGSTMLEGVA